MAGTTRKDQALERFLGEFNCAQSVVSVFAPEFGLEEATALRLAGAFGGGIAHTGETCGAATGALMVIGLKYGKARAGDDTAKERCLQVAGRFIARFEDRCGACRCRDLIGFDLSRPGEVDKARKANVFGEKCPVFVAAAVDILEEIL